MEPIAYLRKHPHDNLEIADDQKAMKFIQQIGIGDAFSDPAKLSDQRTVQICAYNSIRTHIVLAYLFSGCDPTENGFLVICAPRSAFDPGLSAADFLTSAEQEMSLQGIRIIRCAPPSSN